MEKIIVKVLYQYHIVQNKEWEDGKEMISK